MDECPTHGENCPGHLHVEVAEGKVFVSLPGTPMPLGDGFDGWEEVGFVVGGVPFHDPDPVTDWDRVRTVPTNHTVGFTINNPCPDTVALLLGAPMPPPWKRPRRDTSIDLDEVRWTAGWELRTGRMEPLQQFGSFLMSDTEIRFLKDHGHQP